MWLCDKATQDIIEPFPAEKIGHGRYPKEPWFVIRVIPGCLDDGYYSFLICIFTIGSPFYQLVTNPLFTAYSGLERIVLDIGCPFNQAVNTSTVAGSLVSCPGLTIDSHISDILTVFANNLFDKQEKAE